jgi:hypothetical protein
VTFPPEERTRHKLEVSASANRQEKPRHGKPDTAAGDMVACLQKPTVSQHPYLQTPLYSEKLKASKQLFMWFKCIDIYWIRSLS